MDILLKVSSHTERYVREVRSRTATSSQGTALSPSPPGAISSQDCSTTSAPATAAVVRRLKGRLRPQNGVRKRSSSKRQRGGGVNATARVDRKWAESACSGCSWGPSRRIHRAVVLGTMSRRDTSSFPFTWRGQRSTS